MPRQEQKAKDIKGLFIYQDKSHKTVYYDIFTKKGFIISNDDVKTYTLSAIFFPLAIIIFYFASSTFKINIYVSLAISLSFYVVAKLLYRLLFLYKLPSINNYKEEIGVGLFDNFSSRYSKQRLIVLAFFFAILFVVTIIYTLTSGFEGFILAALWLLVVVTFIFLLLMLVALKKKK